MSEPAEVPAADDELRPPTPTPTPDPDPDRQPGFVEPLPVPATVQAGGGEQVAGAFLHRAFFLALHERAGNPEDHPRRAAVCFWMVFVLRFVSAVVVLTIAVVAAWKALSPLPWS